MGEKKLTTHSGLIAIESNRSQFLKAYNYLKESWGYDDNWIARELGIKNSELTDILSNDSGDSFEISGELVNSIYHMAFPESNIKLKDIKSTLQGLQKIKDLKVSEAKQEVADEVFDILGNFFSDEEIFELVLSFSESEQLKIQNRAYKFVAHYKITGFPGKICQIDSDNEFKFRDNEVSRLVKYLIFSFIILGKGCSVHEFVNIQGKYFKEDKTLAYKNLTPSNSFRGKWKELVSIENETYSIII